MSDALHYSVVIPTYRRADLLALCLAKLSPDIQTLNIPYEVIVTDDDSANSASDLLKNKFPFVSWYTGPGRGPAANRNNGAAHAQGKWVIFTDDDCLPDPDWLAAFNESLAKDSSLLIMEGMTIAEGKRKSLSENAPVNETGGFYWSCNLGIRRETFTQLGGFDETFRHACMEDVDFADRIKAAELNCSFIPNAIIRHPWRPAKKPWNDGHGGEIYYPALSYYLEKHPEKQSTYSAQRYLSDAARGFFKDTLPGLLTYLGRGAGYAFALHIYQIKLAIRRYSMQNKQ